MHRTTMTSTDTPHHVDRDQRATDLINAMAALPSGAPARTALRAAAIEAWLPLAERLARPTPVVAKPWTISSRPPRWA